MKYFRALIHKNSNQYSASINVIKGMDYYIWYDFNNECTYIKIVKYDSGKINAVKNLPAVTELTEEEFNQAIQGL